eukprot:gene15491-18206_t
MRRLLIATLGFGLLVAVPTLNAHAQGRSQQEDDERRKQQDEADKKKKLQNPLFFVSHERLSIRNLAKHVKDHDLKILCLKATKAGLNKDLVSLQDMQNLQQAQGPELFDAPPSSSSSSSSGAAASSSAASSSTVKL